MERNIQDKLKGVYKGQTIQRDTFGRRPPTSREVEEALGIRIDESSFPPTSEDILTKDQGTEWLERKHDRKKGK